MLKPFAWLLVAGAVLGGAGELLALEFPTARFPFTLSREIGWMHSGEGDGVFPWFGWAVAAAWLVIGVSLLLRFRRGIQFKPITQRRIQRFKSIRRGYVSLLIILGLGALAALDHLLVGSEALIVSKDGRWSFPAFTRQVEKGEDFGVEGDLAKAPAQYRDLRADLRASGDGWVLMPLIPYAPTGDTVTAVATTLEERDGVLYDGGRPFSGLAAKVYDLRKPERMHLRYRYRDGLKDGPVDGWTPEAERVYGAEYRAGEALPDREFWAGEGDLAGFLATGSSDLVEVHFPASPPNFVPGSVHLLGTNSSGSDVLAYLFGGLQVNFKAALVYIPVVYLLGISIGLLMGFFGGTFDLVAQRLIEVLSNIPFLFVVMIISSSVPEKLKETAGLWIILGILLMFGWMGMTYLMRTSALKEKQRDYIAASRVIGASTPRILFRHLLPNSVAIIVTLVPFSVSSLILALTSLDYLGFGLPAKYATWGQLLRDGLQNLSAPWLVTSAFVALTSLLILITFVGEAVREAFDPKKFSYYR